MRKICVVVGSRANYSSIKSAMRAIEDHPELELQLVVGASALLDRYGSSVNVIEDDGFTPVERVFMLIEGETPSTMAKSTGLGLLELPTAFERLQPDIVVTVGDRFETMATALAAAYMNIPLAHTMGGEVSGTIDESIRHAVTKFAHIHFPACSEAAERIVKLGEPPETVFNVGCPRIDLVAEVLRQGDNGSLAGLFEVGVGVELDLDRPFAIVSQHPITTEYGHGEDQITETLLAVREVGIPAVVLWPNADAGSEEIARGIRKLRERGLDNEMHFFKNLHDGDVHPSDGADRLPARELELGDPRGRLHRHAGRQHRLAPDGPTARGERHRRRPQPGRGRRRARAPDGARPLRLGADLRRRRGGEADRRRARDRRALDPEADHLLMEMLGLVPARGGSRGIPGKNLVPLAGKPLLAWTCEQALASERLTRIAVSTDSEEIAAAARALGVEVIERPPELADDDTPMLPVVAHALEATGADAVVLLQPTSPLRRAADIDAAVDLWRESRRRLGRLRDPGTAPVHARIAAAAGRGRPTRAVRGRDGGLAPREACAVRPERPGRTRRRSGDCACRLALRRARARLRDVDARFRRHRRPR